MRRNRWLVVSLAALVLGGVWAAGCGSTDDTAPADQGGAGSGGGGGIIPEAGDEETSTKDVATDPVSEPKKDAPKEAAGPVACGTDSCDPVSITSPIPLTVEACCSANTTCGLKIPAILVSSSPCVEKHQPGAADTACPATSLLNGLVTLQGCCKPTGVCGYLADSVVGATLDLGCVNPADFGLTPDGGLVSCGGGSDAGTDAADDTTTTTDAADDTTTDDAATD